MLAGFELGLCPSDLKASKKKGRMEEQVKELNGARTGRRRRAADFMHMAGPATGLGVMRPLQEARHELGDVLPGVVRSQPGPRRGPCAGARAGNRVSLLHSDPVGGTNGTARW